MTPGFAALWLLISSGTIISWESSHLSQIKHARNGPAVNGPHKSKIYDQRATRSNITKVLMDQCCFMLYESAADPEPPMSSITPNCPMLLLLLSGLKLTSHHINRRHIYLILNLSLYTHYFGWMSCFAELWATGSEQFKMKICASTGNRTSEPLISSAPLWPLGYRET